MKIQALQVGSIGTNCYILCDEAAKVCAVIDPGAEPELILSAAEKLDCTIADFTGAKDVITLPMLIYTRGIVTFDVAGAAVIKTIFDMTGSPEMVVSGCGLREGLFFEYYASYCQLPSPRFDDILDFSVKNFIGTLSGIIINQAHYDQVTRIATQLFDQLQPLHGYGPRERLLLQTAARMHDVGKIINFYNHARHSAFMIAHAPLYGLTQVEQIITGFIAGFHHGISRKIIRAYRYANMASAEDWIMIRKLSTILALAEASDLTYEQIVTDVEVTLAENVAVMIITTAPGSTYNAADYEMKQLSKQFKKEFGASLLLVWR